LYHLKSSLKSKKEPLPLIIIKIDFESRYLTMKKPVLLFLVICFGCTHQPRQIAVHITLINNNQSIHFTGLDPAIMGEIGRDTTLNVWQNLIPVYRMPADTDMKDFQPVQHGIYLLTDSVVTFTPDTPFVKGQTYFMRYYQFEGGTKPWDLLRGKKKLGSVRYEDLTFGER
jgi:hypothetical protein